MFPMANTGFFNRGGSGLPYTPILDLYPAFSAWSVYKLSSSYAGDCMQVENITSGGTKNIGFDSNGLLDTAAILSFGGTDEIGVRTWYDQSGNSRDLVQTAAAFQPIIADAGVIQLLNTQPAMTCSGGGRTMSVPSSTSLYNFLHNGTTCSVVNVFSADNISPNRTMLFWGTSTISSASIGVIQAHLQAGAPAAVQLAIRRALAANDIRTSSNTAYGTGTQRLSFCQFDPSNATTNQKVKLTIDNAATIENNTRTGSPSVANASNDFFLFGYSGGSSFDFEGFAQELIVWNNDKEANQTAISDNINDRFAIY